MQSSLFTSFLPSRDILTDLTGVKFEEIGCDKINEIKVNQSGTFRYLVSFRFLFKNWSEDTKFIDFRLRPYDRNTVVTINFLGVLLRPEIKIEA